MQSNSTRQDNEAGRRAARTAQGKDGNRMFGKVATVTGTFVAAVALFLGAGVLASPAAQAKPGDYIPMSPSENESKCNFNGGTSSRVYLPGGGVIVTCVYPDGSGWACGDFGAGYDCRSWDDLGNPLMGAATSGHSIGDAGGGSVSPTKADDDDAPERKSTDELMDDCEDLGGEGTLVYNGDGLEAGTYVECVGHDEEDGVDWGWKCGEIGASFKYDCEHWETPSSAGNAGFTSGFSVFQSGVTKAGAAQKDAGKASAVDNALAVANEAPASDEDLFEAEIADACETDADEPQGPGGSVVDPSGQTSAPGPGGGVADPSDPPADPEKKLPFTSGFNIDGSQEVAPVDETEPCEEPDEGDVEPTPEPADEEPVEEPESEQPVDETPEQPAAEEPVTETPVAEQPAAETPVSDEPVTEEPTDEDTNALSTNGAAAENEPADDASEESEDESAETLDGESDGNAGIGLMGILIGAGLALPVALGAVFMRRRGA